MCWYCGSPITDDTIGRSLRCETCGKDLRVCRHCRFYSPGSSGNCRETQAAPDSPSDKERANFCDWFSLDPRFRSPGAALKKEQGRADAAKAAFDNLFN